MVRARGSGDTLNKFDCLWLIAMTDCSASAQQEVTNSAQPKMIHNHSVKRKSPPPIMQRVAAKMDDARTLQTNIPTSNHGAQDSAKTRKRARIDRDIDSSSGTEKEHARVVKQRRKRQSFESTLEACGRVGS